MTRKDFELIASVLNAETWNMDYEQGESLIWHFVRALSSTNQNFDPERFYMACRKGQKRDS